MELLTIVRSKYPKTHPNYTKEWLPGQIVEIRWDGFYDNVTSARRIFCVVSVKGDFWVERGSTDWKTTNPKVYELKKLESSSDSNGKYSWEAGYLEDEGEIRKRDFFIDHKDLLDTGKVSQKTFDSIYDSSKDHDEIDLSTYTIADIKKDEKADTRKVSVFNS